METMEIDAEYISKQCKFIRKLRGLTQENLADAAGLTDRTIQKIESGRHGAQVQTLRSIARAVGFDVTIFSKPTPEQDARLEKDIVKALRKTILVPTLPIRTANDFYSRNMEWHGFMFNTSDVNADDALRLVAGISDWIEELDGIWGLSSHFQRLEYSSSIAELCRELEDVGYLTHFGNFTQQHMFDKALIFNVGFISFLPAENNYGTRFGLVNLDDPWEVPEKNRPTF